MAEFVIDSAGVQISGESAGDGGGAGGVIILLHGLTATRRYVVMGSRLLERSGARVVAYDARGHGRSAPAGEPGAYGYEALTGDLRAVLDHHDVERAVLAGASMGAHTAVCFALAHPERVAGLALITPAFVPGTDADPVALERWDALARGLREGGVEGFIAAYPTADLSQQWRATVTRVLQQRLAAHDHPLAVADALETVPRSRPFEALDELASLTCPALVVGSRDEADPGHPLAVARAWSDALGQAEFALEDEGQSPLAWQGGQLSRQIATLTERMR